ncbi:toxin-antitoxin system TumE family protein [Thiothrix subterranea]|uniref:DUF6516 family protein n=1 Tax=Thiothrix subterranea TaxID=2735563 RepID=A0AA51MR44_9GAMM|nr:DUF6516 family protein [Thiothrix subterranea]MDQ5769062.1 DUF6516 family protein [Thiothrix subterranea]WML88379.1 DUF6516 family protein [Thiothrix subterranea]
MIEAYFAQIEQVLQTVPNTQNLSLRKTLYNNRQGYIAGSIVFDGGDRLDFAEVKNTDHAGKVKYRYQYMDASQTMIFRYDNAPHHQQVATFSHHKHDGEIIRDSHEPSLADVLLEIAGYQRTSN